MVRVAVDEILFEYDEPLVLVGSDDKGRKYVCLNSEDRKNGYWFLVAYVDPGYLEDFRYQRVDLRYLMRDAVLGTYRSAVSWGNVGEEFNAKPFKDDPRNFFPQAGLFLPRKVSVKKGRGGRKC